MLAGFAATVAVIGCSNDYDAFQFRSDDTETGGGGSGGSTSGGAGGSGGVSIGGSSGAGTGGVVTGGGGAPTGGGGAPTGGGGAPTGGAAGAAGTPSGGGGAPTGGGGGPTGGAAGGGGTGGVVTIPGCDDTYGQINGVASVCLQTDATCELAFAATTQTCAQICQEGGGVCQAVYNNDPGQCGHGQQSDCNNNIFNDAVCICSRGCGTGPPCPGNQVCNPGGNCQG